MTISASKRRLREFVQHRGPGKHSAPEAAPRVPLQRSASSARAYPGLHKASASAPRLSGPYERLSGPRERAA